jgi:YHS domain-containing protein
MKNRNLVMMLIVACLAALVVLGGCKKKEQPPAAPKTMSMEDMQKQAASTTKEAQKAATATAEEAKKTATAAAAEIEQTMCPVMDGNKIDKNVFVEYKGKKVYFCCADCKAKFEAGPEKYIANLPQFAK